MSKRTRRILASIAVLGALLGTAGTATAASVATTHAAPSPKLYYRG